MSEATDFRIGDGVGWATDAEPTAVGTVVDFVYVATAAADDRSQVRVYWRDSGGVSDHRPQELFIVEPTLRAGGCQ